MRDAAQRAGRQEAREEERRWRREEGAEMHKWEAAAAAGAVGVARAAGERASERRE